MLMIERLKWIRALATLSEDAGSNPSTYDRQLTNAYNSSFRGVDAFFWPPLTLVDTYMIKTKIIK